MRSTFRTLSGAPSETHVRIVSGSAGMRSFLPESKIQAKWSDGQRLVPKTPVRKAPGTVHAHLALAGTLGLSRGSIGHSRGLKRTFLRFCQCRVSGRKKQSDLQTFAGKWRTGCVGIPDNEHAEISTVDVHE